VRGFVVQVVRQQWYRDYIDGLSRKMLFDVLAAANYMEIKPLLDLTCLGVTFILMGKNAEEVGAMCFADNDDDVLLRCINNSSHMPRLLDTRDPELAEADS
jgi:hypothetical protein